jgi:hypothetical protein
MKKQLCIWSLSLMFLLAGFSSGWCAARSESLSRVQSQERLAKQRTAEADPNLEQTKRERFKMLEWVIMQDLLEKYQHIEKNEDRDLFD